MKVKVFFCFGLFSLAFFNARAIDILGLPIVHDPATIIKDGTKYYEFCTGTGIRSLYSYDLITWYDNAYMVFNTEPSWCVKYRDNENDFWAPDIIYMNNAYYLFYSCSSWGSSYSAIGVAKTKSLNTPSWTDLGEVVSSDGTDTAINAIDPGIFRDDDGKVYMSYGSWFGGIGIIEIDTVNCKSIGSTTHLYGGSHQSIEASYIFKDGDYYYLVVNRGNCCFGVYSTYYITVGRGTNVKGPYENFRTLLSTDGKYIGPGHFGLLRECGNNYVSIHYYDGNNGGLPILDILKMTMVDGWPVLTRDYTMELCPTGIYENERISHRENISFYPNPSEDGNISIEIKNYGALNKNIVIQIYSTNGSLVYTGKYGPANIIDIRHGLNTGLYNVLVKTQNEMSSGTLVIK